MSTQGSLWCDRNLFYLTSVCADFHGLLNIVGKVEKKKGATKSEGWKNGSISHFW